MDSRFHFVDQATCPLCGGDDREPLDQLDALGYTFHWVLCRQCALIRMDPVPDLDSYVSFYEQGFWEIQAGEPSRTTTIEPAPPGPDPDTHHNGIHGHVRRQRLVRVPRVETVLAPFLAQAQASFRVLEIGCSWGQTLARLHREHGATVFGVEPSLRARAYLDDRHPAIEIVATTCENLADRRDLDGSMDLVMFSHCLENITDQNAALTIARRLLREQGTLYVDTPNFDWNRPQSPYHPFLYTPETLTAMLAKNGFRVETQHTTPTPGARHWANVVRYARHSDQDCAVVARPAAPEAQPSRARLPAGQAEAMLARQRAGRRAVATVDRLGSLPRGVIARSHVLRALLKSVQR